MDRRCHQLCRKWYETQRLAGSITARDAWYVCRTLEFQLFINFAVDLKYISGSQIICVSYEGIHRRFSVSSLLPRVESDKHQSVSLATNDHLAQEMGELTIDSSAPQSRKRGRPDIWLIDWDTTVSIVPQKQKTKDTIQTFATQALHQGHRVNTQILTTGPSLMIPSQMSKAYLTAQSLMRMPPLAGCISRSKRFEI